MRKYIKLEDAIEVCRENQIIEDGATTGIKYPSAKEITIELSELPTIDIVRCNDCKYSEVYLIDSNEEPQRWCKVGLAKAVDDDDYCSWGE